MRRFEVLASIVCAAALAAACKGRVGDEPGESAAVTRSVMAPAEASGGDEAAPLREEAIANARAAGVLGAARIREDAKGKARKKISMESSDGVEGEAAPAPRGVGGRARTPEGPTRAWFPETFLFEPLVVTDAAGAATVPVRVPDRLTTWRVLALGHTRAGAQGGAVTSFLGTLPVYVDPVIPPFLVAGDELRLPIQMINTTDEAISRELSIEIEGAAIAAGRGARTIPARGSLVEYATLTAARAGAIKLRVGLGATDAVERSIEVAPAGRPVVTTRSGTLAAPRTLAITAPAGADPATDRVRLMVFPGALALLRAELAASTARGGVADDAYALLLAGRAPALLASLGDEADPEALRTLSIVAGQRAIRHARTLDVPRATALAAAALAHPQRPVLARLGERAAALLHQRQRPDGTFEGGQGWTLQRVLVATADGTRAVGDAARDAAATPAARQRAQAVAFRAAGAFERAAGTVQDGYTAAAILATGAVRGPLVEELRRRVRDAVAGDAGGKWLTVGEGVVRADGAAPGRAEATALAVLALEGDPQAAPLRADLGATLLGAYAPARGWGDGRANLACMQAVLALFQAPLPASVTITLSLDGRQVASGTFDREKLRDVLVLEGLVGGGGAGAGAWRVAAEPAVPGLGYALALHSYVPWAQAPVRAGLELSVPAAVTAAAGRPTELTLSAIAPSGAELHVTHALPAGVQPDRPSLEALVTAGTVARFEVADGRVELYIDALDPGEVFTAKYRVIPTFAGRLQSGPSRIHMGGGYEAHAPPTKWTIR